MTKPLLDSDLIGPDNDVYRRLETAAGTISKPATRIVESWNGKLHWSWGDSKGWRFIIGVSTEAEFAELTSGQSANKLASELIDAVSSALTLDGEFKLYLELDSDERVEADEGWFFRIKSDPQPGRELTFNQHAERPSVA